MLCLAPNNLLGGFEPAPAGAGKLQVKQETEAYLRQLEREGGLEGVLGQDVALVAPTPAFVVKTHRRSCGGKVFINVCSSDKVGDVAAP